MLLFFIILLFKKTKSRPSGVLTQSGPQESGTSGVKKTREDPLTRLEVFGD